MKRYVTALVIAALNLCLLTGCSCEHEWIPADCSNPNTCALCEEVEGAPLGHVWAAATCDAPRTCTTCGETDGDPLGHSWVDASCETAKTCSVCGSTEGEALGHREGSARLVTADYVACTGTYETSCDTCGEFMKRETLPLTSLHGQGYFLMSPREYVERLNNILLEESELSAELYINKDMNNSISCDMWPLDENNEYFAYSFFYDGDYELVDTDSDTQLCFREVWTILDCTSTDFAVEPVVNILSIIMACDPTMDADSALEVYQDLAENDTATVNGITYTIEVFDQDNAILLLTAIVEEDPFSSGSSAL